MFTPIYTSDSIKAETAYRQERAKRDFRAVNRHGGRPVKPRSRRARRAVRPTTAR